jgi:hypothetical protein
MWVFGWAPALDPEHYLEMCVRESQDLACNSRGTYCVVFWGGMEVVLGRGDCHGSGLSIGVRGGDLDVWLSAHNTIKTSTITCVREIGFLGLRYLQLWGNYYCVLIV